MTPNCKAIFVESLANPGGVVTDIEAVATIGMITDVVRTIGGDAVAVSGLMGPGIDPHTYKPRASDITTLGDAEIIFYGGLELEGRMTETFEKIDAGGAIPTIAVAATPSSRAARAQTG